MPAVSLREILQPAFAARYGVGAFNIVNDLTMAAVLDAAVEAKSPVIIQVSVKTVKMWGAKLLQQMFTEMTSHRPVPATLHLDHCPDIEMIKTCLQAGWNSVLFDASSLSYQDNLRLCQEVVAFAKKRGAGVEGELEAVRGIEDDVGSDVEATGIDCFAPAIGTAHGLYKTEPKIDFERVSAIVARQPTPIVLHGGTGLSSGTFKKLIAAGCAKVNISTMLKITFADSFKNYLEAKPKEYDPMKLQKAVHADLVKMAKGFMETFGSAGRA
jgi:ketose-bisphosphate aldolase